MMNRAEHYREAEYLLAEGVRTHDKISSLARARSAYPAYTPEWNDLTRQMDEYGKKCMGIWAQAQAHATLATAATLDRFENTAWLDPVTDE